MVQIKARDGFSLIELMVVIAIVAILAAIAVPVYKTYAIKAKVMRPFQAIEKIALDFKINYQNKGVYPSSFTLNGVTVPAGAWTNISGGSNYNGLYGAAYALSGDGKGVILSFSLTGLEGIAGYVTPSSPNNYGTGTNLIYGIREINGVTTSVCGGYLPGNGPDLTPAYLPNTCTCASVSTFYLNGTC